MNLTSNKFCLENARELALFARVAYDEPPTIADDFTDTNVLIRDLVDCVVVAFRGTADIRNFITDAEAWRSPVQCGEIHHGFWNAWLSIKAKLMAQLSLLAAKPIFVTGHSLGGALAMICGKYLATRNFDLCGVYTFGCPRVGDKTFAKNYDNFATPNSPDVPLHPDILLRDRTFTVINDCDIVPRIPGYICGNRRPGHDEFIPAAFSDPESEIGNLQLIEDPSVPRRLISDIESLFGAWLARRSAVVLEECLTDHHIDNYIAVLNAIAPAVIAAPAITALNS